MMMMSMLLTQKVREFFKKEEGQGMVEYALIIALVAIAIIAVLALLGPRLAQVFQDIMDEL